MRSILVCLQRRSSRGVLCAALFCAAWALYVTPVCAGAWVKAPGQSYTKLSTTTFHSEQGHDAFGVLVPPTGVGLVSTSASLYAEVGLVPGVALVAMLPYVAARSDAPSGIQLHTLGLGDAQLGLQWGGWRAGPWVFSTRGELKLPLYAGGPAVRGFAAEGASRYPRASRYFPALGDGQVDVTVWGAVGVSGRVFGVDAFFTGELGPRYRSAVRVVPLGDPGAAQAWVTANVTPVLALNATGGAWVVPGRVLLMVNTNHIYSAPAGQGTVRGKGYIAIGPSMMVRLGDGIAVEMAADWLGFGVNAATGGQATVGVSLSID